GPLAALVLAVGAGMTESWRTAALAGGALLLIRVVQDYVVNPRVLGGVVGLSPLLVLVAVSAVGVVLGPFYVLVAVPLSSLLVTVMQVVVMGVEPAEEERRDLEPERERERERVGAGERKPREDERERAREAHQGEEAGEQAA